MPFVLDEKTVTKHQHLNYLLWSIKLGWT